jgi:isochorismate hydrolase
MAVAPLSRFPLPQRLPQQLLARKAQLARQALLVLLAHQNL